MWKHRLQRRASIQAGGCSPEDRPAARMAGPGWHQNLALGVPRPPTDQGGEWDKVSCWTPASCRRLVLGRAQEERMPTAPAPSNLGTGSGVSFPADTAHAGTLVVTRNYVGPVSLWGQDTAPPLALPRVLPWGCIMAGHSCAKSRELLSRSGLLFGTPTDTAGWRSGWLSGSSQLRALCSRKPKVQAL